MEMPHVKLADRGGALRPVRHTVDHEAAHATDALAAIVIEGDRILTLSDETLVDDVEHLQERHMLADPLRLISDHLAGGAGVLLPPDVQSQIHLFVAPLARVNVVELERLLMHRRRLPHTPELPGRHVAIMVVIAPRFALRSLELFAEMAAAGFVA